MTKIAILGAGGWGTALAIVFSRGRKPHEVSLWVHNAERAGSMQRERENKTYLPGAKLPESIRIHGELEVALSGAQVIVGAVPSAHARAVYASAPPFVAPSASFVSAGKGLEPATHLRMSEVIAQVVTPKFAPRIAVISGPSFALEAARGEPTAVVLASRDAALVTELQEEFAGPNFRLYTNDDVLGVELAGAMKNVMAIAAGACQGLGGFGAHLHWRAQPQSLCGNRVRQRTFARRNHGEHENGGGGCRHRGAIAGTGARASDRNANHRAGGRYPARGKVTQGCDSGHHGTAIETGVAKPRKWRLCRP